MEISIAFKSKPKLVFNGREYGSVDEMPEDVRRLYRDAIALAAKGGPNVKVFSKTELWFNGKKYNSVNEMPPDVRLSYDKVMKAIDANQNGGRAVASPRRSLFSVVSMVSLIILLVWLVVIILRHV
jgi:hypothetical protein